MSSSESLKSGRKYIFRARESPITTLLDTPTGNSFIGFYSFVSSLYTYCMLFKLLSWLIDDQEWTSDRDFVMHSIEGISYGARVWIGHHFVILMIFHPIVHHFQAKVVVTSTTSLTCLSILALSMESVRLFFKVKVLVKGVCFLGNAEESDISSRNERTSQASSFSRLLYYLFAPTIFLSTIISEDSNYWLHVNYATSLRRDFTTVLQSLHRQAQCPTIGCCRKRSNFPQRVPKAAFSLWDSISHNYHALSRNQWPSCFYEHLSWITQVCWPWFLWKLLVIE